MTRTTRDSGRIERLGLYCYRRRWLTVAAWGALLVVLWAIAGAAGGEFRQSLQVPGTESQAATDRLDAAGFDTLGGYAGTVVVHAPDGVEAEAVVEPVTALLDTINDDLDGVTAHNPYTAFGGHLVSADGTTAVAHLDFDARTFDEGLAQAATIAELRDAVRVPPGVVLELGGDLFAEDPDFSSTGIGLVAAAVILLVAFGSLLAMGLPLGTALLAIGCAVAVVQLASRWIGIPPFAPAAVAMIALGAGTNYCLFIVTRYREELAAGAEPRAAAGTALATAGRAAVFAGATVATSLVGLLVVGIDDVRALALAIVAGVVFVLLGTVTLLPALLGFVRERIDRIGLPQRLRMGAHVVERSPWYRWSRLVQRRPLPVALLGLIALAVLAAPAVDLRLGMADASTRPVTDTTRRAHELVADGFGPGYNGPVFLAVSLPGEADADAILDRLAATVERHEEVANVLPPVPSADGRAAFVQVIPSQGPQHEATAELVHELRAAVLPAALDGTGADALVGGVTAAGIDFGDVSARVLPWFITVVLVAAFVLLAITFRSLLVPLKAVLVNLLTVAAAYGVVVAVFQWGWLAAPLGLAGTGPIEPWVPMMLFAITFGLSIDYEVFLLSRIREHYLRSGDNATAVADGLARSARLIFAAAAIMVCVFGAFVLAADRPLQILGLGLAVAIAIDATLVRLVLVPAAMELLGDRNWWLPRWPRPRRPAQRRPVEPPVGMRA